MDPSINFRSIVIQLKSVHFYFYVLINELSFRQEVFKIIIYVTLALCFRVAERIYIITVLYFVYDTFGRSNVNITSNVNIMSFGGIYCLMIFNVPFITYITALVPTASPYLGHK